MPGHARLALPHAMIVFIDFIFECFNIDVLVMMCALRSASTVYTHIHVIQ